MSSDARQLAERVKALETRNRELSLRIFEFESTHGLAVASTRRSAAAAVLQKVRTRLLKRTWGRRLPLQAQWVLETGLFDATAYKALAGLTGKSDIEAAAHYATVGERKGLRPSPEFDPVVYGESYPDLLKSDMGLFVHYARHGRAEGRIASFEVDDVLQPGGRAWDDGKPVALVCCHDASRTGAPILGWNLVRAFGETHNVVAILLGDGELADTFLDDAAWLAGPFGRGRASAPVLARLAIGLERRFAPDFAICNSMETYPLLHGLARTAIPSVALVHEFPANIYPAGSMTSGLMMATQAVFDAEVQRDAALEAWPGLTGLNQHVFHQGASAVPRRRSQTAFAEADRDAARAALTKAVKGPGPDRPVVLGLGTVCMRKGVDLFVSCAQAVTRRLGPRSARFVWIGDMPKPHPDGNYPDWLADQIKRAGLGDGVAFLDPVDDLTGAFEAADVVLSSSRLDPFPNVAMDAAMAGVPVVCFDKANGFAEFLAGAEATRSLAVPFLDIAAAADCIADLLEDPDRRRELGAGLKARAERDFSMARYIERLEPVIATARAIKAQEARDAATLRDDDTFAAAIWLNPHETMRRDDAIRFHVRKAASGQESNQYCRRPALGFVPQTYADAHPALQAPPFENPLAHWIRAGKPAGPWWHAVTTASASTPRAAPGTLRTALHLHLHYPELADGMLAALAVNAAKPDLFVSTTSDEKAADLQRRFAAYRGGAVAIRVCPNRGRDIGPMLSLFAADLQRYEVVGHLHGKRSLALTTVGLSTDLGAQWHDFLMQHLLGPNFPMLDIVLERFAGDPRLGLVFPEDPNLTGWSLDRDLAVGLARRMDPAMVVPRFIDFPIGTMFWMRPAALEPLFDLGLDWTDFPEEPVPIDGTMLHALERLLPVICHHAGFTHETTHVPGVTR